MTIWYKLGFYELKATQYKYWPAKQLSIWHQRKNSFRKIMFWIANTIWQCNIWNIKYSQEKSLTFHLKCCVQAAIRDYQCIVLRCLNCLVCFRHIQLSKPTDRHLYAIKIWCSHFQVQMVLNLKGKLSNKTVYYLWFQFKFFKNVMRLFFLIC